MTMGQSVCWDSYVGYWVTTFVLDGSGWLRPMTYFQPAYGWVVP